MQLTTHTAAIRETLAELARTATQAGDEANANALNQAAYQVGRGVLANVVVDVTGELLIPSKGESGTVYRTGLLCTCKAGLNGKPCWHAALFEGVQTAQERATAWDEPAEIAPAPGVVATIAAITEAVHGLTDHEYALLVAEQQPTAPPADAWEAYHRGEEIAAGEPWAPDYITELWPDD